MTHPTRLSTHSRGAVNMSTFPAPTVPSSVLLSASPSGITSTHTPSSTSSDHSSTVLPPLSQLRHGVISSHRTRTGVLPASFTQLPLQLQSPLTSATSTGTPVSLPRHLWPHSDNTVPLLATEIHPIPGRTRSGMAAVALTLHNDDRLLIALDLCNGTPIPDLHTHHCHTGWIPPGNPAVSPFGGRRSKLGPQSVVRRAQSLPPTSQRRARTTEDPVGTSSLSSLSFPQRCPSCLNTLRWFAGVPFAVCGEGTPVGCGLTHAMVVRSVQQPTVPRVSVRPLDFNPTALVPLRSQSRASVSSHRFSSIRHHPDNNGVVVVCEGSQPVALLSTRQAALMRALFLLYHRKHAVHWNESDVAAALAQWTTTTPADEWPVPGRRQFRGQHHVFAIWEHLPEPGFLRPCLLPSSVGNVPFAHPSTSAYARVSRFNSPLSIQGHRQLLQLHPLAPFLINSLVYGFPLCSHTPPTARKWYQRYSELAYCEDAAAKLQEEFDEKGFIPAPTGVPLRFSPLNAVFSNKIRWVSDLTAGTDSVNNMTDRTGLIRAVMAQLPSLAARINFMHEHRPGVVVLLAKFDVKRAYRQLPLAIRDLHRTAHHTLKGDVVNARLMLGAKASCDLMAHGVSAIVHLLASHGFWSDSYVDDLFSLMYEDEAVAQRTLILSLFAQLGWPLNMTKLQSEGTPTTRQTILGVDIDTAQCTAFVSVERRRALVAELRDWLDSADRRSPRDYASLAGKLQFIAPLFPFGAVFIRSLYTAAHAFGSNTAAGTQLSRPIPIAVRQDLHWWESSLDDFDGYAYFGPPRDSEHQCTTLNLVTDASGFAGAAVCPDTEQFAVLRWTPAVRSQSSTAHWEAAAIVLAVLLFANTAAGGLIRLQTDSWACYESFTRMRCHDSIMHSLLRVVAIVQLRAKVQLSVSHIPGKLNSLADIPSRKGVMQTDCNHFQQYEIPLPIQNLLLTLLGDSRQPTSTVSSPPLPLESTTGGGIAEKFVTTHNAMLQWTPWKRRVRQAGWPTLRSGC